MKARTIRIGNSSGFWGDDPNALKRQLKYGNLHYLTADYLAEVSMSILRKQQNRNPDLGYVKDFIDHVLLASEELKKSNTRIVTNAGGNNPIQCAVELDKHFQELGIEKKIFAITGDNIIDHVDQFYMEGVSFENTEDGRSFSSISKLVQSANVYSGSETIVKALEAGADIVIAGRVADSALTIGSLIYEFNWRLDDWDRLASAMIAGHIIECGSQSTGGNFTDWRDVKSWNDMGFPIIEMEDTGEFIVTKADNSGGLVNEFTVKEQLVYEIGDPRNYLGPDVISDITSINLQETGENKVKISGAKGKPAPETWKVSIAYHDGFKCAGSLILSGPDVLEKANLLKEIFWDRLNEKFEKTATNFIGYNACHQELAPNIVPNELLIQFSAFDHDKNKLDRFARHLSAMILGAPPSIAVTGGRPKIQEVLRYWPALIHKHLIKSQVFKIEDQQPFQFREVVPEIYHHHKNGRDQIREDQDNQTPQYEYSHSKFAKVKMNELCLARSGDKGNMVNIGVLARDQKIYEWIKNEITVEKMKEWFSSLCEGRIRKFVLDNLRGLNFTLEKALDGGGTYSGRIDPQGKTFASAFLALEISVPREILPKKGSRKILNE